jgi:hypothetical protein
MKKQFDFFFKIASSPNFNLKDYYKNDKTLLKLHKQFEKELTNKFTMKGGVYEEYNPVLLQQIVDNATGEISGPGGTNAQEYCEKLKYHLYDQKRDIIYDRHNDNKLILLPTYIDGTTGKKFYKKDFRKLNEENQCNIPDDLIEGFVDPDTKTNLPSAQSGLLAAHQYNSMDELHGLIFHGDSAFTSAEQEHYKANRQQNINEAQYARGKLNHDEYKRYKAQYPDHYKGGPATTTTPATTPATTTPATKAAQQESIFEY